MRVGLAVLVALLALAIPSTATADDTPCADTICAIPGPPSGPATLEPAPVTLNPPRQPVAAFMHHPAVRGPGHDVQPCVTIREYRSARGGTTKAELERRWEVVGKGRLRTVAYLGRAWVYPRCGFSMRHAAVVARYDDGRMTAKGLLRY